MSLIPWKGKRSDGAGDGWGIQAPLTTFRSEMDRLFDRFIGGFDAAPWADFCSACVPSLDVIETDKETMVKAEIPGVDPKDLDITISGNVLTLAGQKDEASEQQGENFRHCERRFGSFRRSVTLPTEVATEKISAEYKNGLLLIRLQKLPTAMPKRIPVRSAAG